MSKRFLHSAATSSLLLAGGLLISVLLAEALLRIFGVSFPVFDTYDELRGVALRPGKEGWYRKEGNAFVRINSFGYRDKEHDIAKPVGVYRVAVLGDSFTEARQVAQEDTFWSLLGQGLGSCPALKGRIVETLNFGVGGYGTTEELLTLRKDVLQFSPDLVLLAFFPGNDVQDNSKDLRREEGWRMPKPAYVHSNGKLVLENTFRSSRLRRFLYEGVQYSRFLELINEARRAWSMRRISASPGGGAHSDGPIPAGVYAPPSDAVWREAWLVTEELLGEMSHEVTSSGARFVVAVVPTPEQVHPDQAVRRAFERRRGVEDLLYPSRRLSIVGGKYAFPVISLVEPMQRLAVERQVYLHGFANSTMGEGHWNEAGHREAATILIERICADVLGPTD